MSRPVWEVADAIRLFGSSFRERFPLNVPQKKALTDLANCRTAALGGHVDACEACGAVQLSYNSCRNRHCPKCQGLEREAWVLTRESELLPVPYYHVVFTLPAALNGLCLHNPGFCYNTLFESAWKTLRTFAADAKWLGAKTGATMVLHTWGQQLLLHPTCIVLCPAPDWTRACIGSVHVAAAGTAGGSSSRSRPCPGCSGLFL